MMGLPSEDLTGQPVLFWGLYQGMVDSLNRNVNEATYRTDFDYVSVTPDRPNQETAFPAIIVNIVNMVFEREGLLGYVPDYGDPANPREFVMSKGTYVLEVLAMSTEQLWTLQDYITQQYMNRERYDTSFYRAGERVDQVGIGLNPGQLAWSNKEYWSPPWTDSQTQQYVRSSCTLPFEGNHWSYFSQARISDIEINASTVPTERKIRFS